MEASLRTQLRIQIFLRKNQRNWKRVRLRSRPRILNMNQRKCIRFVRTDDDAGLLNIPNLQRLRIFRTAERRTWNMPRRFLF